MRHSRGRLVSLLATVGLAAIASAAAQGQTRHTEMDKGKGRPAPPATIRITMDELHAQGGVPRGWKFLMPPGDVAEGRKVFVAMECFACHDVKGEDFAHDSKTSRGAGPELRPLEDARLRGRHDAQATHRRRGLPQVLTAGDMHHGDHQGGGAMKMDGSMKTK